MATGGSGGRGGSKKQKCASFSVFEKNLKRSRAFIKIFGEEKRSQGAPTSEERELLRGALVFSIGALDNFVHELILEIVPKFGGNSAAMRHPLQAIAKNDPSLALRVALAGPGGAEDEFRAALDDWLETQSFHGVSKIVGAMNYVGVNLGQASLPIGWQADLDRYTDERHKIVHRGSVKVIKREEARACTDLVEVIAREINAQAVRSYH